jgi:hypothetical protein
VQRAQPLIVLGADRDGVAQAQFEGFHRGRDAAAQGRPVAARGDVHNPRPHLFGNRPGAVGAAVVGHQDLAGDPGPL